MRLLESVLMDTLSYVSSQHGSGAYWLGRAYAENDQVDRALGVWRSGLLALQASPHSSIRLADTFVQHVYEEENESNYLLAGDAYRLMLEQIGTSSLTRDEEERLARRLRHLGLVLPEKTRRRAGLPSSDADITPNRVSGVRGQALLTWWRSQDPLPATRVNEQLHEHLQRVAHSLEEYGHSSSVYGFDERGEIYVRLGPPDEDVTVNFTETRLTDRIYERKVGVDVSPSDFPANEFWSYGQVDRRLYYIFVQEQPGDPYTIGTVRDLLPRTLRSAYGSSRRAQQRSIYALSALRAIYRKYSPFHPNMARRHDEVANYLQYVTSGGQEQFNSANDRSPSVFLNKTILQDANRDAVAGRQREDRTPNQLSTAGREHPRLQLAVRTARFLNEDGATRTEVYWTPESGAFRLGNDRRDELADEGYGEADFGNFLVQLTAVQQEPNYQDRVLNRENYHVTDVGGEDSTIPTQTFSTQRGDSTLYHLRLQWDQYLIDADSQSVGPKMKVATERRDSLRALSGEEDALEMSDLKPVLLSEESAPRVENALPYPFRDVSVETPIALYFEVYRLAFGADDRSEYTVEYTVRGRAARGKIAEFFLGDDERETVVSSTYEGTQRTAEELIRLDVADWDIESQTTATVTVQVTDESTGQQVERTIEFEMMPAQ